MKRLGQSTLIARGDGGKMVFDTEPDCQAWMARKHEACEKFGWMVHAWVLMGNHVHVLLETPEPNLGVGMKWLLGVYAQGWNRRRKRRGHLFQGRYRAVVVNGEERAKDRKAALSDESLTALRRGWFLGDKSFGAKVLDAIAEGTRPKRKKGSVAGPAARAHDEAEAEHRVALPREPRFAI